MPTFGQLATQFLLGQTAPPLPAGLAVMNPYLAPTTRELVAAFYQKFYADERPRTFMVGINPGRFGGGSTGLSFTDPVRLAQDCGIVNPLKKSPELSSQWVYTAIAAYGGPARFFADFYLTAMYPLALVKNGKNYNYYDDEATVQALWPAILASLRAQISWGAGPVAICFGKKNEQFLRRANHELGGFAKIITLDHPRFIMQYRRQQTEAYLAQYLAAFAEAKNG
ncbi:MAG: DUF4918 family protein [Bernardetiaceae bacterium]|jgi:hypothetical protein|nr:DUF4918 family protein [Bernardetiaceae bacterium]